MGILHAGIVNALPSCKVTAICETEPLLTRVAKKILRGVAFYKDASEMVQNETIDAVFITSPIQTHTSIIRSLLKSGAKPGLFSEKPLAANSADALQVAEAATKQQVVNMVGFHKRFSPVLRHAKQLLEGGAIGEVQSVRCCTYTSDIFRKGSGWRFRKGAGGVLLDLGPHLLDLLLWWFGEPKSVSAVERSFYSSEVEDYVHAIVRFRSDVIASLDISWSQRGYRLPEIGLEVQGTNGSMSVSDDYVRIHADKPVRGVIEAGRHVFQRPAFNTSVDFLLAEPEYTFEDKSFLMAIMEGNQEVEPNFHTAAKVNEFVDLIHKEAAHEAR